nr:MAG TPA: hypothetical protein [Caudoviricetes sp.]
MLHRGSDRHAGHDFCIAAAFQHVNVNITVKHAFRFNTHICIGFQSVNVEGTELSNHFSHLNHLSGWVAVSTCFVHHGYKYKHFFLEYKPCCHFSCKNFVRVCKCSL